MPPKEVAKNVAKMSSGTVQKEKGMKMKKKLVKIVGAEARKNVAPPNARSKLCPIISQFKLFCNLL